MGRKEECSGVDEGRTKGAKIVSVDIRSSPRGGMEERTNRTLTFYPSTWMWVRHHPPWYQMRSGAMSRSTLQECRPFSSETSAEAGHHDSVFLPLEYCSTLPYRLHHVGRYDIGSSFEFAPHPIWLCQSVDRSSRGYFEHFHT